MEIRAQLSDVSFDTYGRQRVTFTLDRRAKGIETLMDKMLRLTLVRWREKRSLNANALLWQCLDKIADTLCTDKWEVYLLMLKRYGKFTYVIVPDGAVEKMKTMWRELEVIGEIDVNGRKATQILCYYGSHTYDTKEFSRLLDGVISEMQEMGIPTPMQEDLDRALKNWEKQCEKARKSNTKGTQVDNQQ